MNQKIIYRFLSLIALSIVILSGCELNNANKEITVEQINVTQETTSRSLFKVYCDGNKYPAKFSTQEYRLSSNFSAHIWELYVTGGVFLETNSTAYLFDENLAPPGLDLRVFHISWTTNAPTASIWVKGTKVWLFNISNQDTIQIQFFDPPGVPANLNISSLSSTSCNLSWSAVNNAISYRVYNGSTLFGSVNTNNCIMKPLNGSTTYTFYVSAVNSSGESSKASITVTTPASVYGSLVTTAGTVNTYCYYASDLETQKLYAKQNAIASWEAYTHSSWSQAGADKYFTWLVDPTFTGSGNYFVYVQASGRPLLY